ncbi:MAG: PBS lyase [Planctomycetaceae bacterium]|nr:MAG: PBS lyase [Planctomycetaceae bacterium]
MPTLRHVALLVVCCAALIVVPSGVARGADGQSAKEKELIAILRSDAPAAEKAITCKHLAVHGSSDAVADLAKLLSNEQLASWARIALEAIPGAEADEALRKATESLTGKLLVGTINSIGVRHDANAVELLTARLKDADVEVASAAAVALGHIGNASATKALRGSLAGATLKVRSAVAEGCILCAERLMAEGQAEEASAIYDEVRKADVPKQRMLEATRGAILSRKNEGIALLLEQFRSPDKALMQIALSTAREFPGKEIDAALAAEVAKASPERAPLLIEAMADRQETVVLSAVLQAAEKGPKAVRLAAIGALGRVGNASCLSKLLEIAQNSDAELAQSAKGALAGLPGDGVNQEIIARLSKADVKLLPLLIEVVGQRRIDALNDLLKAVDHSDAAVRTSALKALGEIVDLERLSVLVNQVVKPKNPEDVAVAQQALKTASVRMPDREACASQLAAALDRSSTTTKVSLLEILGAVGGTRALEAMGTAAKSSDAQLQDASSKLLGEWMTADAAPVLLDLSKSAPGEKYQVRALRGYIRIARQFVLPEAQRVEMCQKALDAAKQPAEKKLVLDILKRYPSLEMLKLAIKTSEVPELKDDAKLAALAIAQKLGGKSAEVKELLARIDLPKVNLEIVKATYGGGATQKDVTEVVQKAASDLPMITLASASFNAAFGGDPIPGTAKQLKIQYKINGKSGEASFAEDTLIILPMPK